MNKYFNMFYVYASNSNGLLINAEQKYVKLYKNAKEGVVNSINGASYSLCIYNYSNEYLNINEIINNIYKFIEFAKKNKQITFLLSINSIAPVVEYGGSKLIDILNSMPDNIILPNTVNNIKNNKNRVFFYLSRHFESSVQKNITFFSNFFIHNNNKNNEIFHNGDSSIINYYSNIYSNIETIFVNKIESSNLESCIKNYIFEISQICNYFYLYIDNNDNFDNIYRNVFISKIQNKNNIIIKGFNL